MTESLLLVLLFVSLRTIVTEPHIFPEILVLLFLVELRIVVLVWAVLFSVIERVQVLLLRSYLLHN